MFGSFVLPIESQYLNLLERCLNTGDYRQDRTGVGARSLFGAQIRHDLQQGFPLLTTKKVHFKSIVVELLWFLRGDTNVKYLQDHGVSIWDEWADENGDLGPVYGKQWRSWERYNDPDGRGPVDQIANVIDSLRRNPYGRRHIVTAWNPAQVDEMALPPCHCMFQFLVSNGRLSCQLYQRSADIFLGVPFNIASYALLTHLIAREAGLRAGEFIHTFGDVHLYENHVDQAHEQLQRTMRELPSIAIADKPMCFLECDDIMAVNYNPHPAIKAPVAV